MSPPRASARAGEPRHDARRLGRFYTVLIAIGAVALMLTQGAYAAGGPISRSAPYTKAHAVTSNRTLTLGCGKATITSPAAVNLTFGLMTFGMNGSVSTCTGKFYFLTLGTASASAGLLLLAFRSATSGLHRIAMQWQLQMAWSGSGYAGGEVFLSTYLYDKTNNSIVSGTSNSTPICTFRSNGGVCKGGSSNPNNVTALLAYYANLSVGHHYQVFAGVGAQLTVHYCVFNVNAKKWVCSVGSGSLSLRGTLLWARVH